MDPTDISIIAPGAKSRSISFENPTGEKGAGGTEAGGRKGAPMRIVKPGERLVLADIEGPGTIRHIWMTFPPAPPEIMRAKVIEVFYDGSGDASISVPAVDFFGVPWGRPVHIDTALTSINEGRGFNSFIPMPFARNVRLEFVNASPRPDPLYFQVDYTLEGELPANAGYLHAEFRRQNPTVMGDDFVITDGWRGPGRFVGCVVGVRVLDGGTWYGEGEVKVFLDGDKEHPTICGTGLEDYVGSAWGLGPHQTRYLGAPLEVRDPGQGAGGNPAFVGFYRWHVLDPVLFERDLRVTIQQIGFEVFTAGEEDLMAMKRAAGTGFRPGREDSPILAYGIAERVDDYCATAFVVCREPQPVRRVEVAEAIADIERRPYEKADPQEALFLFGPG